MTNSYPIADNASVTPRYAVVRTTAAITAALADGRGADSPAAALRLFADDYSASGGRVATMVSSAGAPRPCTPLQFVPVPASAELPPSPRTAFTSQSTAHRVLSRRSAASSLAASLSTPRTCRAPPLTAAARVATAAVAAVVTDARASPARRPVPLAAAVIADGLLVAPPNLAPPKKKYLRMKMIGLTPKSGFLGWLRAPAVGKGEVTLAMIRKEVKKRRDDIFWHFDKGRGLSAGQPSEFADAIVTRSSVSDDDDWVVDPDAAACSVSSTRRLDRYVLEHIFTLPEKTSLLLLVSAAEDTKLFDGRGAMVDAIQKLDRKIISGKEYFQLRCTIFDTRENKLVIGGLASKMY